MRTIIVMLFLTVISVGQESKYACKESDKTLVNAYFASKSENEALVAKIRRGRRSPLPFCWHGCAVQLPKPMRPEMSKTQRVGGSVTVSTIADETGRVFYAKPIEGPTLFRRNARVAACEAKFKVILHDERPIKFPWSIKYNFIN